MSLKHLIKNTAIASGIFAMIDSADNLKDINSKLDVMSSDMSSKLADANFKLDDINESINKLERQTVAEIGRLKQSVEKGFSDISLELAMQSDIFRSIDRALKDKVAVEAKEYMRFGVKALQNKWYDDAKADFEKSIELNRYDYKVYYLLSKCYEGLGNRDKQDELLMKALHYAKNDPHFQQYIGLDMVGLLMNDGEMDYAKEVAKSIIDLLPEDERNTSPLMLCQLKIDVKANKINEDSLTTIGRLLDNQDYKYQIKMMKVVMALTDDLAGDYKVKIDNLLNLKKADLSKTCGMLLENSLNNTKDLVQNYIRWNLRIIDLKIAAKIMTAQKQIMQTCLKDNYEIKISSVDDFNKYYVLLCESTRLENGMKSIMKYRMDELLDIFKEMKKAPKPSYDFEIENDRIIWQAVDREDIITLTANNIIITKNALSEYHKPVTYTYSLDAIDNLEFEKFIESSAWDDFYKRYKIETVFDKSFYKKLFAESNMEPKKCFYVLRDVTTDFDIITGTQYNYNNFIADDISDGYSLQKEKLGAAVMNDLKKFESVESIMDKAQRLKNAYDIMKYANDIFTSFNNILTLLDDGIGGQKETNNNDDIEFID